MALRFRNEPKDQLFAYLTEPERGRAESTAERLLTEYHLEAFHGDSPEENYRENLFYIELLERALTASGVSLPFSVLAADVGCSSWFYVQGLYALLRWWHCPEGRNVTLVGYEVDADRRHPLTRPRIEFARAHLRSLEGAEYRPQAFAPQPEAFDILTMLFPFVFMKDHQEWRLSGELFRPERLVSDAWLSVKPGGLLAIVNQGEPEHGREREILEASGITPGAAFRHDSLLFQYELPRYALVAVKNDEDPGSESGETNGERGQKRGVVDSCAPCRYP